MLQLRFEDEVAKPTKCMRDTLTAMAAVEPRICIREAPGKAKYH
jgi:hypothetical protein